MNAAYGLAGVLLVVVATVLIGVLGVRISRTTSDFYVASRTVTPCGTRPRSAASICRRPRSSASRA